MSYEHVKNSRQRLKERLAYVMGGKCCLCGYDKCITALEFHHKDPEEKEFTLGYKTYISFDKALIEAKKCILVCANCHREIHSFNLDVSEVVCYDEERAEEKLQELQELKTKTAKYCKACGKIISEKAEYCVECSKIKRRTTERPDRTTLKELIRNKPMLEIGRMYNVSDQAIRKWCKSENLPSKKSEINSYSDEEWNEV